MNIILLEPTDVLFFRDGRPMGGPSSGHGAAWPLPSVINHAFHAALHRAGDVFKDAHAHRRGRSGDYQETRDRKFGSLVTAGPFPVYMKDGEHTWFFPRPLDSDGDGKPVLLPIKNTGPSSLPKPLCYPVASSVPPSKQVPKPWWSEGAWNAYLGAAQRNETTARVFRNKRQKEELRYRRFIRRFFRKNDSDFSDTEHACGIEIAEDTGSVVDGQFYSAHYLRLRAGWNMGVLAAAPDKDFSHPQYGSDLVRALLNGHGTEIIAGGQQRVCTAKLDQTATNGLPLPRGRSEGFHQVDGKHLLKWVLLTPAIFPKFDANPNKNINAHSGGWLPNWIAETDQFFDGEMVEEGSVLLLDGPGKEKARRKRLSPGQRIKARLVAAVTGKPVSVTGWALKNDTDRPEAGAKSTHLAVPAGSVYYFECGSPEDAQALANALNWHGSETANPGNIRNRRSTLMGEKGFGLGVCDTWDFHTSSIS